MTTQIERMMKVETQVEGLNDKLESHTTEQREDFDKVFEKLDNLQNKFAGKWVEKVLVGILITVIAGIIIGVTI